MDLVKMLKYGFLVVLAIIFILDFSLVVYASSIRSTVFYPEPYIQILEENNGYETLRMSMIESMSQNDTQKAHMFSGLITEDWVKSEIDRLLVNFLAYIRSDMDTLNLTIRTNGQEMTSAFLNSFVTSQLGDIPACEPGQEPSYISGFPDCMPANISREEFAIVFLEALYVSIEDIEQMLTVEVDIVEEAGPEAAQSLQKARDSIQQGFLFLNMLIVLLFVVLTSMIVITFRSMKSMLKWVGSTIFVAGSVCFVSALLLSVWVHGAVTGNLNIGSPELNNLMYSVIFGIIDRMLNQVEFYSGVVLVLGAFILIVSVVMSERPLLKGKTD